MSPLEFLLQPTSFLNALLQILIVEGLIAGAWYAVWYELDKKKAWFVRFNTNTGIDRVFRARLGQEGYRDAEKGKEPVMVKLEAHHRTGFTTRGPIFVYDGDTGRLQKPLIGGEGTWNGLDGKWWLQFVKAEMEGRVTSAAGGNLEQLAKWIIIGLCILAIPLTLVALKVFGAIGGA